jgi:hypothetical protein
MRRRSGLLAALGAVVLLIGAARDAHCAIVDFSAILTQAQEVPTPAQVRGAGGFAMVKFDDATNELSWNLHWFGLSNVPSAAHFHGPADPGVAAGVQVGIPNVGNTSAAGSTTGSAVLNATQVQSLLNNKLYINIHTPLNGPGEIRGQVGLAGSSALSPIFPANFPDPAGTTDAAWLFQNVPGSGGWFDPTPANGFIYETTDGLSNFTAVILPTLAVVPDANGLYTVADAVNGSATVAAGALYSFPTPVNKFTVTDILPEVDADNPVAFPTFLAFDQATVSFKMTPIPEPSTLALACLGTVGLAAAAWRKRRGR